MIFRCLSVTTLVFSFVFSQDKLYDITVEKITEYELSDKSATIGSFIDIYCDNYGTAVENGKKKYRLNTENDYSYLSCKCKENFFGPRCNIGVYKKKITTKISFMAELVRLFKKA